MNIEWFTETASRGFQPKISLRPRGQIGFNRGAVRKFKLQDYAYAVLGFDRNSKTIAIKLSNDPEEKGAVKLGVKQSGTDATISAKSFFDYYEIPREKTLRLDAEWDAEIGAIIVKFKTKDKDEGGGNINSESSDERGANEDDIPF